MQMTISEFNELVLLRFTQELTDRVFLMIQEDRELMQLYLDAVGEHGKQAVNSHLAKAIGERFGASGQDQWPAAPKTLLIKGFKALGPGGTTSSD
ncbi:MAG: hypothetical protein IPK64_00540 [bacterium]|nr:hypothetical protein [bacterium]